MKTPMPTLRHRFTTGQPTSSKQAYVNCNFKLADHVTTLPSVPPRPLRPVIQVTEARLVNTLDLDLVDLEVKGHFRIKKVQPEVTTV
jgi:hypothetical protein